MSETSFPMLLLAILLSMSLSALAQTDDYSSVGFNDYQQQRGTFNTARDPIADTITKQVGLTAPKSIPIYKELTGNNDLEIFIIDDTAVRAFEGKDLTAYTAWDFAPAGSGRVSQPLLYDIDGDNASEFIFVSEDDERIYILNFNESGLSFQSEVNITDSRYNAGATVIACRDEQDCFIQFQSSNVAVSSIGIGIMMVAYFNSTGMGATLVTQSSISAQPNCAATPIIENIAVSDLTNDGDDEYVISYFLYTGSGSGGDSYFVKAFNVLDGTTTEVWSYADAIGNDVVNGGAINCQDAAAISSFSSPIAFDFDPAFSGNEVLFGAMNSPDTYNLWYLSSTGVQKDSYPAGIDDGAGILISNPFVATTFPTGSDKEVCITGYDEPNLELTMICGSETASQTFETYEYTVDVSSLNFNITRAFDAFGILSHSAQHSNALTDGVDLNEILTAYGVYTADFSTCSILANCDLERIFIPALNDGTLQNIDGNSINSDDLLMMSKDDLTLVYIDDKLSNAPATVTQATYNPCIVDSTTQQNTTVEIAVVVTDGDQGSIPADLVSQRVTYYSGTGNAFVSLIENVTSGSPQTHSHVLNATATNAIIKIEGWDSENPSTIDDIEQFFNVAVIGVEFGETQCTSEFVTTTAEDEAISILTPTANNTAVQLVTQINDIVGWGTTAIWLVFMTVIAYMVLVNFPSGTDPMWAFLAVALLEVFLLVLGVLLGFVSIFLIIVLIIISSIPIGFAIRKQFTAIG